MYLPFLASLSFSCSSPSVSSTEYSTPVSLPSDPVTVKYESEVLQQFEVEVRHNYQTLTTPPHPPTHPPTYTNYPS